MEVPLVLVLVVAEKENHTAALFWVKTIHGFTTNMNSLITA